MTFSRSNWEQLDLAVNDGTTCLNNLTRERGLFHSFPLLLGDLGIICWEAWISQVQSIRPLTFFIEYSLDYYAFWFSTGLMRRLAEFRAVNTEDETVMNYFDELEIHPDHLGKFSLFKMELTR